MSYINSNKKVDELHIFSPHDIIIVDSHVAKFATFSY